MKAFYPFLLLGLSLTLSAQTFTKLNDPAINSRTGDWYAVAPIDIDNNYTLDMVIGGNSSMPIFYRKIAWFSLLITPTIL